MVIEANPRLAIDIWRYNTTKPPLDKLSVRQALNLAIDRDQYQKFLEDTSEGVTGTMVFPGSFWAMPAAEQQKLTGYEPNMEDRLRRARQMLTDAGLGSGFTLTAMGPMNNTIEDNLQALESLLGKINVKIKREPVQQEEARQRETDGLFDIFLGGYGIATIDPVGVIGDHFLCNSGRNTSRLCDPELDKLYEQQLRVLDPKERAKVVQEMDRRAVNSASMNIINWNKEYHVRWPFIRDYVITPSRYTDASKLEYVWLDK
jgi:ABC-type transport system substrate-binding protein